MWILEDILDFRVSLRYYKSDVSIGFSSGFGNEKCMFPKDRDIYFLPNMAQGRFYIVIMTDLSIETRFTVIDLATNW